MAYSFWWKCWPFNIFFQFREHLVISLWQFREVLKVYFLHSASLHSLTRKYLWETGYKSISFPPAMGWIVGQIRSYNLSWQPVYRRKSRQPTAEQSSVQSVMNWKRHDRSSVYRIWHWTHWQKVCNTWAFLIAYWLATRQKCSLFRPYVAVALFQCL